MTETRPSAAAQSPSAADGEAGAPRPAPGIVAIFGTGDHTVLGRLWIGTGLLYLLGLMVLAAVIGVESLKTGTFDVFSEGKTYAQGFSLLHIGLVVLAALPLLIGIATVVVPKQIGASTVAFPRAMAAAFWGYVLGGALVVASFLIDGGPSGARPEAVDLFHVSLGMVCVSLILASISLATTVLALRPAGMTLDRVPAFAWSVLVGATIWIAGLAVLVGLLVLLYIDGRYRVDSLRLTAASGEWLAFLWSPPQVLALGIPVLGFAADVVPTLTGKPQKRHGIVLGAIGLFGVATFGAWTIAAAGPTAHPHLYREALYTALAVLAVLPILAVLGGLVESVVKGNLVARPPLLFAIGSLLVLGGAATVAVLRVVAPFHILGTTADDAVLFATIGAVALAAVGAAHWWWPQLVGQHLKQPLAVVTAALLALGAVLWATPLVVTGFLDEPLGSLGKVRDGVEALNGASMVGAGIVAVGVLIFLANLAGSLGRTTDDTELPTDPWDGYTLEWATDPTSVPVGSATPLLDQKEASAS